MQQYLRTWRYKIPSWIVRAGNKLGIVSAPKAPIGFVIERADWAIRRVGESIRNEIEKEKKDLIITTTRPEKLVNKVVHFGSQYMWLAWGSHMSQNNKYVTSFFHGKPEDGPETERHIEEFLKSVKRLKKIIVSASIIEQRLINWGVPREKVTRIPIGVDTKLFVPPSQLQRESSRKKLGLSAKSIVIGSFQKDGVGWGDGMEPKRIKGPDIFVETVRQLKKDLPVSVLLTGPARGYVKHELERNGIPWVHTYVENYSDLISCYHALDFYLITSREEGGPMGLMESMAAGVPVVSTPVGMGTDLIKDGFSGGLVETIDAAELANKIRSLLENSENLPNIKEEALKIVESCSWSNVAKAHLQEVYLPLMKEMGNR